MDQPQISKCLKTLCHAYASRREWAISEALKASFHEQVDHWFKQIPVEIRWLSDKECPQPFKSMEEMKEYWKTKGVLLMLSEESTELGRDCYSKHRAIHDWFGHLEPNRPFGGPGESSSFLVHAGQYTPDVLPIVFSDVVMSNAYWAITGRGFGRERWIDGSDLIPLVQETFQ